jgi:hypothetical protein
MERATLFTEARKSGAPRLRDSDLDDVFALVHNPASSSLETFQETRMLSPFCNF